MKFIVLCIRLSFIILFHFIVMKNGSEYGLPSVHGSWTWIKFSGRWHFNCL